MCLIHIGKGNCHTWLSVLFNSMGTLWILHTLYVPPQSEYCKVPYTENTFKHFPVQVYKTIIYDVCKFHGHLTCSFMQNRDLLALPSTKVTKSLYIDTTSCCTVIVKSMKCEHYVLCDLNANMIKSSTNITISCLAINYTQVKNLYQWISTTTATLFMVWAFQSSKKGLYYY